MSVPEGSTLYHILALDKPEELGGVEQHIGDLVLRSQDRRTANQQIHKLTTNEYTNQPIQYKYHTTNKYMTKQPTNT